MSIDPVALVRRFHAALNSYDADVVTPMFAAGAVYVSPGVSGRVAGRDAIMAAFNSYFAEFPDQRSETLSIELLSPHQVRTAWRLEATARSTGQRITRQGAEVLTFDEQGRIVDVVVEDQC